MPAGIVVLLVGRGWSAGPEQKKAGSTAAKATAEVVRAAWKSEAAGDDRHRETLLRQALYESPDDASLHWQLGHIRVNGKWPVSGRGRADGPAGQAAN